MQLRYMGFDQTKNVREYKFDGVAENETTKHFVVSADLTLFVRYHVGLQEGPALCLKKFSADLGGLQQLPHELTSGDLVAAAAERKTKSKAAGSREIDTPSDIRRNLTVLRPRIAGE